MNAKIGQRTGLEITALAIALSGCVTINVYFPAAAAEKAADKIIDQVYRIDPAKGATSEKPAAQ
jgi:hypothetical protein